MIQTTYLHGKKRRNGQAGTWRWMESRSGDRDPRRLPHLGISSRMRGKKKHVGTERGTLPLTPNVKSVRVHGEIAPPKKDGESPEYRTQLPPTSIGLRQVYPLYAIFYAWKLIPESLLDGQSRATSNGTGRRNLKDMQVNTQQMVKPAGALQNKWVRVLFTAPRSLRNPTDTR